MTHSRKSLHLNLLLDGAGNHPQAARLSREPYAPTSLAYHADLVQLAERGKFDAITLLDSRHIVPGTSAPDGVRLEALTLLGALAALTQRVGLVAQVPVQHTQPYNTARRLASLDHTSRGRAGWLLNEHSAPGEAGNFDRDDAPDAHQLSVEYVDVLRRLWDSWRDDARVVDKVAGQYVDVRRIEAINHIGAAYKVSGPIDIPRPPQGHPPVLRRGTVDDAAAFADSDVALLDAPDLRSAHDQVRRLAALKRAPLALPVVRVLCSPSDTQRARYSDAVATAPVQCTPLIIGRPDQVATELLDWVDQSGVDGFSLDLPFTVQGLEDVVDYLIPELQARGRFRTEYEGNTLRDHLGLTRPAGRPSTTAPAAPALS